MKKKYAMLLMNPEFDSQHLQLDISNVEHHIITVRSIDEAIKCVMQLADEGFGAIEVCGAFGKTYANQLYEATSKRVPIGYVIYPENQVKKLMEFWEE